MKKTDIEIPWAQDRGFVYRFFEILPGFISYSLYATPIILSLINPTYAAYFLIFYVLTWVFKSLAMSKRVLEGYSHIKQARQLNWAELTRELKDPELALGQAIKPINRLHKSHYKNLKRLQERGGLDIDPDKIIHAVMIATYNEGPEIIHPTIDAVIDSKGVNSQDIAFFLAYEERAGEAKAKQSRATINKYRTKFRYAEAVEHVLQDDEIAGKGANANYAGSKIVAWADKNNIDPSRILVTVLDADNRPDPNYLACLTYTYAIAPERKFKSYQPIAIYNNNVWEVPAIMRLSAMANTYFHTANSMRLHALRNFSAHAQSLDALIDTNFWSARTIVEDGHQFWRTYFRYDGKHEVLPLYTPIYQDAVYAGSYKKTLMAQFKQIRRWTYGASDIAYFATKVLKNKKVPRWDALTKFGRLLEGHVGWATSAPLLLISGWIPLVFAYEAGDSYVAQQLPRIIGRINTGAVVLLLITMYVGIATLPPRPGHHRRFRYLAFFWQWLLIPIVGIVFNSFASINSQTRLMFKRYLERFDVTEKQIVSEADKNKPWYVFWHR